MARLHPILAALWAAVAGCTCGADREAPEPEPPLVETAVAEAGDVPEVHSTIGTVESINTVQVRSRVGGQLLDVTFVPGSVVHEGDPLFQLDPRPFEEALAAAEANLAQARTQARQAGSDARRYSELEQRGAVAAQQAEQSRAAARGATAAVRAAEAQVEQARLDLEFTTIRAPVKGRTGELSVRIGDQIQPNSSDPLVTIQVMDPIYVRFELPADLLPQVRRSVAEGELAVRASPRGQPDLARDGTLEFIDNQVNPATGTILLKALFENSEEIFWPGEPTEVRMRVRIFEGVTVVPSSAVQMGPQGPFVFVVHPEERTVEARPVRLGPADEGRTAILEGVSPGELVVTTGQLRLQPGMEVRLPGTEP